ncbi:MAG: DUF2066 domain-containing protein [Rhodospirillales bacterium]
MRSLATVLFLVLVANSFTRSAEAADPYTVSGIVVDLTRETSAIARKEAIESAHVEAFERLFKRLSVSDKSADFPEITYLVAADHTAGFKIDDEVTSETRYAAKITISFVPERISNFFQEYRIQFTDKQAPSVIVVPVLAWAGALSLWQQNNPWRTAWAFLDTYDGLTPVMNPKGDLVDVGSLSPYQAVNQHSQRLKAISARYGAAGVLLAQANYRVDFETGNPVLEVAAEVLGGGPDLGRFKYVKTGAAGSSLEALCKEAAFAVMNELDAVWKQKSSSLNSAKKSVLIADFELKSLSEFGDVRLRLDASSSVTRHELVSLSKDRARFRIYFDGTPEEVRANIAEQNMDLVPSDPGSQVKWVLIAAPKRSKR